MQTKNYELAFRFKGPEQEAGALLEFVKREIVGGDGIVTRIAPLRKVSSAEYFCSVDLSTAHAPLLQKKVGEYPGVVRAMLVHKPSPTVMRRREKIVRAPRDGEKEEKQQESAPVIENKGLEEKLKEILKE